MKSDCQLFQQQIWTAENRLGGLTIYVRNHRLVLNKIIDYDSVDFSNNTSEHNMKTFVIGQKN